MQSRRLPVRFTQAGQTEGSLVRRTTVRLRISLVSNGIVFLDLAGDCPLLASLLPAMPAFVAGWARGDALL